FHGQTKKERQKRIRLAVDETHRHGVFKSLAIDVHFSDPFNPNGKAPIESGFRAMGRFAKLFDSYCGEKPENRPERLKEVLKNLAMVPTFAEVERRLADFIEGDNASK